MRVLTTAQRAFGLALAGLGAGCQLLLSFDGIDDGISADADTREDGRSQEADASVLPKDASGQDAGITNEDATTQADVATASDATTDADATAAADGTGNAGCTGGADYRALVLCDLPAAYWRFGERGPSSAFNEVDAGPVGAYDPSGMGGIQYGVPGAIVGDPDTAVHLNGSTLISAGTALPFPGVETFSLEAWVRPDVIDTNYRSVISRVAWPTGGHKTGYALWSHANGVGVERYAGTSAVQAALDTIALPTTTYSHIVATYDGAALSIYANGMLAGALSISLSVNDAQAQLQIGNETVVTYPAWIGDIDEVAVYTYALSAAQVSAHYRRGRGQ